MAGKSTTATKNTASPKGFDASDVDDEDDGAGFTGELPPLPSEFGDSPLVSVATGFPPYWEPEKGKVVDLIPRMVDFTDLAFPRVICQYIGNDPLKCSQGAKDDDGEATEVFVQKGESFTISWFATLPLEFAIKSATPLRIVVLKKQKGGKNEDGTPKSTWIFDYQTNAAGKTAVMAEKSRAMAFGPRNLKKNPTYLFAFTQEGLTLKAPTPGMAIASGAARPAPANAEA